MLKYHDIQASSHSCHEHYRLLFYSVQCRGDPIDVSLALTSAVRRYFILLPKNENLKKK